MTQKNKENHSYYSSAGKQIFSNLCKKLYKQIPPFFLATLAFVI